MEIRKLELNLGQKTANPFKTTRKSNTNPFKYNDFEGNAIDPLICADVLVSFKGKESKLKMISSSVIGSMTKLRNSITEPIAQFVNRVKTHITGAIDYVHNNAGIKNFSEKLHTTGEKINSILSYDVGKGISDCISGIGKNISEKIPSIDGITGLGKEMLAKWTEIAGKVNNKGIPSGLSVAEYEALWRKEIELAEKTIKEAA